MDNKVIPLRRDQDSGNGNSRVVTVDIEALASGLTGLSVALERFYDLTVQLNQCHGHITYDPRSKRKGTLSGK